MEGTLGIDSDCLSREPRVAHSARKLETSQPYSNSSCVLCTFPSYGRTFRPNKGCKRYLPNFDAHEQARRRRRLRATRGPYRCR